MQDQTCFATLVDATDRMHLKKAFPETLQKIDENKPLNKQDLINMIHCGLSSDVIIDQIKDTNTTFYLSSQEMVDLKNEAIPQSVIEAITYKKSL